MTQNQKNGNVVAIVMMIFLFGMISFVTNLAAPMGVIVKMQFLEGSANANFLGMLGNFCNFLAYLFMGIPAGLLLQKFGYKKTALMAIAVGFAGVGIQFFSGVAESFIVYLLGAFVCGFCVCMLNTVVNPMLNSLGGEGKKGNQLLQIGGTFNSLAGTLTPMLVGALIGQVTRETSISNVNPLLFAALGVFALTFIVLNFVAIPEKEQSKTAAAEKSKHSAWAFRHFVLGAVGIFIYVGVEVGIPATLFFFLESPEGANVGAATAGFVAGTYWFLMLIGRFIGGAIGGKVSSKAMLTVAAGVGILLVLTAIFSPQDSFVSMPVFTGSAFSSVQVPICALFLVLVGLCTSVMWGGIFNLAVEGLGKYVAAASGIFMTMVVGGGILPLLQNYIADSAGYMTSYWVPVAGLAYLFFYALIGSKNVNTDIDVK
ncbi:MAG: MFS transporter [Prevotellaceae bacterium]|jgi:FHS family L-fucose permease-like MFS transporter|nr:MFS transporter [Prevotellaceae bacterium]